ncbi:hypothetical protein CAPTEDRAFT_179856 [Capitella teleta]|uniref:FYVE-type domain-containing protein n=1 Tax=Capitella teleta TaxID=283909 RepID=R7T405_CAPTE|nr:hypothetical protein CAPTEDRAFT_179856 [Capitella teleta]|eukprot:ELT87597.1 hypothetical protein CAPTEDRAFT_179856 [Capitella teleta]
MFTIRRWIFRPKKTDSSALAQFFHADEELNLVAAELDSFDGRKEPERCSSLVSQLRQCQDKVLTHIEAIMDEIIPDQRSSRDYRVKFPDDVLQENLAGQLWFGAECLAAGSSIMNREVESASMRPLAKAMTRHLDALRAFLREQCFKNLSADTAQIKESLMVFDRLFAEFELSYVSAMVPVKTTKEYEIMQDVTVLFSETVCRSLRLNLLAQEMIDDCDPALMFTIPRLAIVVGLLVYPEGPLNPDLDPTNMSEMFRPFQTLLYKIRSLLWTLSREELWLLEKSLCTNEDPSALSLEDMKQEPNVDRMSSSTGAVDRPAGDAVTPTVDNSVIYTSAENSDSRQVTFITNALNEAFVTDLSFQGATTEQSASHVSSCDNNNSSGTSSMVTSMEEKGNSELLEKELTRTAQNKILGCGTAASCCKLSGFKGKKRAPKKATPTAPAASDLMASSVSSLDYASSDTSSYSSDCHDDEEIALAIQAAELASRKEARSRFKNSTDLIHRLFVCVSGVADQLQTNYAGDLRHILKPVFDCYAAEAPPSPPEEAEEATSLEEGETPGDDDSAGEFIRCAFILSSIVASEPPEWLPDDECHQCMACEVPFTFVRRRHHCRNCGKIFCARCSANSVCLPHFGHAKPVRVCNHCFLFQVTPFTISS